jgi:RNA recognition motif-containing protein
MKTEDTFIKNEGTTPEHLGNKVFVGGLPLHVDKDALQDFFSCFGPVTDVSSLLRVSVSTCHPNK